MAPVEQVDADLKQQIVAYFRQKGKMLTMQNVAKEMNIDHRSAKKLLTDLINDGVLEFTSYGGATFIKLVDQ